MIFFKAVIVAVVTLVYSSSLYAQQQQALPDYKLVITLENAPFDSLYLLDYTNDQHIQLPGKKKGKFTWEITIPDHIANNFENMKLKVTDYDAISNSTSEISFFSQQNGEKKTVVNVGVEDRINFIHAHYRGQVLLAEESFMTRLDNKDTLLVANVISENFELDNSSENADMTVRMAEPYFSWFMNFNNEKTSYQEYLIYYKDLVQKYPDSRYLISGLANNLNKYKSVDDIKNIYKLFSEKHKKTDWAKKIETFTTRKFENSSLSTLNQNRHEDVIQNPSKLNLIVFTASWCVPCLEEIPLLKEINNDLQKALIMTYISIDEKKDILSFQKVISEHNIPWRSLLAYEDTKSIKEKYFVSTIPHVILVYPDGQMENMNVRDANTKARLYAIVNNTK